MLKSLSNMPEKIKHIASVISAIVLLGSTVASFSGWILYCLVTKMDAKIDPIANDIASVKLDTTRLQLLYMIQNRPENESEILKIAQYYFTKLGGDWYVTDIFNNYCAERNIHIDWEKPI